MEQLVLFLALCHLPCASITPAKHTSIIASMFTCDHDNMVKVNNYGRSPCDVNKLRVRLEQGHITYIYFITLVVCFLYSLQNIYLSMLHTLTIIKTTPDVKIVSMVTHLNIQLLENVNNFKKKYWDISLWFPLTHLDNISQQCSVISHFSS